MLMPRDSRTMFLLVVAGATVAAMGGVLAQTVPGGTRGPTSMPVGPTLGKGKIICLDAFYNQEKNGTGFHYHWDDTANPGMSKFGEVWKSHGATLSKLDH